MAPKKETDGKHRYDDDERAVQKSQRHDIVHSIWQSKEFVRHRSVLKLAPGLLSFAPVTFRPAMVSLSAIR